MIRIYDKRGQISSTSLIIGFVIVGVVVIATIGYFSGFFSGLGGLFGQRPGDYALFVGSCELKANSGFITIEEYCGSFKYVEEPLTKKKFYVSCGYPAIRDNIIKEHPEAPLCAGDYEKTFCEEELPELVRKEGVFIVNEKSCQISKLNKEFVGVIKEN